MLTQKLNKDSFNIISCPGIHGPKDRSARTQNDEILKPMKNRVQLTMDTNWKNYKTVFNLLGLRLF